MATTVPAEKTAPAARSSRKKHLRPYERVQIEISLGILILVLILTMFPIFYVLMTSVNTTDGFPRTLIPDHFTLNHYSYVLAGPAHGAPATAYVPLLSGMHAAATDSHGQPVKGYGNGTLLIDWDKAQTCPSTVMTSAPLRSPIPA